MLYMQTLIQSARPSWKTSNMRNISHQSRILRRQSSYSPSRAQQDRWSGMPAVVRCPAGQGLGDSYAQASGVIGDEG